MARRTGRVPQHSDSGVGGIAGEVGHGERSVVEGLAVTPQNPTGAPEMAAGGEPAPVAGGGAPGADLWGPTRMPQHPAAGGSGYERVTEDDPDARLRMLYEAYPHPDILALIHSREF